jgi:hypothetical protein
MTLAEDFQFGRPAPIGNCAGKAGSVAYAFASHGEDEVAGANASFGGCGIGEDSFHAESWGVAEGRIGVALGIIGSNVADKYTQLGALDIAMSD